MSQLLEAIDPVLDATATANLSGHSLCKLLYCVVKARPNTTISSLRVNYYCELNTKFSAKYERLKTLPASGVPEVMNEARKDWNGLTVY